RCEWYETTDPAPPAPMQLPRASPDRVLGGLGCRPWYKWDLSGSLASDAGIRPRAPRASDGNTSARTGRRLHHVRGHLARRGYKLFWRSPHLRGNARLGVVRSRTVELTFH